MQSVIIALMVLVLFALCFVGFWAYSLLRRQIVARRNEMCSGRFDVTKAVQKKQANQDKPDGALSRVLTEAGLDITPVMLLSAVLAVVFVVGSMAAVLFGAVAFLVVLVGVILGTGFFIAAKRKQRCELIGEQLIRVLPQLSAGVASSLTLERALRVAAKHAPEPLNLELAIVLSQASYGIPLDEAFATLAQRTNNKDAASLASSLRVQRRFGGSLVTVIDLVTSHANAKVRMERELKSELSGTKLAQWFVSLAMPAIFLLSFVTNSEFARFYTQEPLGWAVLGGAAAMEVVGVYLCKRITTPRHKLDA